MAFPLARRATLAEPFLAMEVMERALELERQGRSIVHLEVGEPEGPPPPAARLAIERALDSGGTHYTDSRGLLALRTAIARHHAARSGSEVDPDRVIVTSGTSPAMLLVFSLLVEPGDEVILGAPHYPCYPNFVHVAGGVPVYVATHAEEGYALRPDRVKSALTPRTRAIVVASPANPTGAIQPPGAIGALADLGVPLISDEVYAGLEYEGAPAESALGCGEDVFVLDGFSKRYAMTGFRLGYLIAPRSAVRPLQTLAQSLYISASEFVQHAGIAALESGAATARSMLETLTRRRALLCDGLTELGFGLARRPAGAFYAFANAEHLGASSRRLAFDLLEEAGVATAPGIDFGRLGEGHLRFSWAASETAIREGLSRLRAYVG